MGIIVAMQDLFGEPADVDGFYPLSWVYRSVSPSIYDGIEAIIRQ